MPFDNIGPLELVIVLVIALIVIGPKRLPEVGKSLGKGIREFKDSLSGERTPAKGTGKLAATAVDDEVQDDVVRAEKPGPLSRAE